jgi:hypothetical protein
MLIRERALDAMMPFNGKESVCVMDKIDFFSVSFHKTLLSLTLVIVVHFLLCIYIGNGSVNDANQMLLNIPSNQPKITTTLLTHCSLTSSYQGHDKEHVEEVVNENNIDDNQQRREEEEEEEEEQQEEDASSHNCDVGSTDVVVPISTKKKLKHCYSSSTLLPPLIPRSSSTTATTSTTAMLRHHRHSRHDAYRTLQLPVNSTNKLLIITPNGQHRPITTTTGSENNLRTTGTHIHTTTYNHLNNSNSCFDDESVRTLSRGKLRFIDVLSLLFTLKTSIVLSNRENNLRIMISISRFLILI